VYVSLPLVMDASKAFRARHFRARGAAGNLAACVEEERLYLLSKTPGWEAGARRAKGAGTACADGGKYVHGSHSPVRVWLHNDAAASKMLACFGFNISLFRVSIFCLSVSCNVIGRRYSIPLAPINLVEQPGDVPLRVVVVLLFTSHAVPTSI